MSAPGSYRDLRDTIATLPAPERLPWLVATLRDAAAEQIGRAHV